MNEKGRQTKLLAAVVVFAMVLCVLSVAISADSTDGTEATIGNVDTTVPEGVSPITTADGLTTAISTGGDVYLGANINEVKTYQITKNVKIHGMGYTIAGNFTIAPTSGTIEVLIEDLIMDGKSNSSNEYGISSSTGQNTTFVDLTIDNCKITDYSKKGIYLTNAVGFHVSNSIFGDNANTNETSSPQIFGDYAIDLNLICVRNAVITIENNRFYGDCGDDAAVKITQRGGYDVTDDTRTDFTNVTDNANIQSLTISGNDFSNITHVAVDSSSPGTKADIQIGSGLGTGGAPRTYTYGYDFSITSKGNTIVSICDTLNGFLGLQLSNNAKLTGNGEHVAPTGDITKTTGKLDLALEGSAQIMGKVDGGVTITGQVGSSMTIPAGKTLAGKVSFSDGASVSSVEFTSSGITAGTGSITLKQGSVVISGTIGGSETVSITATGDVVFDDASSDVELDISTTDDGSGKVIIKDLTLNENGKLDIQANAYVEVPENGKLVNNSTADNAISNAGTLVLNTQITTTTTPPNENASKISNTGTVAVYPGYDTTGITGGGTVTSSTSEGDYLGLNKNLDSDYEIKTGAFLEKELTINAGVTLTISSGAFLDLNGKTLTVLGNLVVKNGGYITSGGNTSGNIGTIVLGKTGSIDNSGILGKDANVIVTVPADSGRDVYTDGSVTLRDVSGIGIGLDKKVNSNDVTYTLVLSGDASKKNNVPGTITVTGTVYVDGTLYIGNGITLAGTGTLELKKGATLDLNSKGAVYMTGAGTIQLNDGSTFNVSGSTTAKVSASTGKYVTSQTYAGAKTYTTTVSLTNIIGLVITAESNDYYDDVSEKTITENRLILSGTVKQGSFVSGSNTADAGVVITKDGTLDTSITSNKMEYGGVYVVDTLLVDKSVKTFKFTTGTAGDESKFTVLGTVTYEDYAGTEGDDFADNIDDALIGAMYSVESTDSYGVKTEKYLIKSFDGAFGDIADAVDQTITVYGPVEVSTEIVLGADQTIEGGDFTITVDGKITVDNDANMTVASMDVQGILVDMADGTFSVTSDENFTYSTKSENEAGDITYAGFVVALNNAKPGDVIEISQETKLSSSFTIPAEVTVKVTETGTITNVTGKVINMTVNGTLINEGTVDINGNTTVNGLVDITEAGSTTLCGATDKAVNVTGEVIASSAITANINAVWYQNDDGEYVYTTLSKAVTAGSAMDVKPRLTQVGTVSDSAAVDLGDMTLTVTGTAVFGDIAIGKGAVTVTGTGVLTASITGKTGDEGADTATVDLSKAQKVTVSGTSAPNAQNVQVWSVLVSVVDAATSTTLTGAVTVSDGTVRLGSDMIVSGQNSLTVADGAELVIPDGKILDAQSNSDRKAAVTVNGTMTVNGTLNVNGVMDVYGTLTVANAANSAANAAVNVNAITTTSGGVQTTTRYVLNIYGTLNVVESEDNGDAQATISGILAVGSKPTTVGAGAGAVAGPVEFNGTGYIKAYPGADLTAAKIAWNLQNESEAKASVFNINGAEYMTVYAMGSTVSFQDVLTDETFELVGYELSVDGEAGYDIKQSASWKADADLIEPLGTNIGSSDAYIKLNASKVPVVISVGTGISLYIDGIKYTTGNEPHLSVGTHTFTVNVDPGYKGDVTVQFNGQTVTGSFTITPEMASAAYEGTVSVSASGNITQDSTVVVDGGSEDGLGLTDILLIILVVLIVVMAIMVAMRLMRS